MAAAKDKVQSFISEYNKKLQQLNGKLQVASKRKDELTMEIQYIKSVELVQATERRVIDGDSAMENKVLKSLSKLEAELQNKEEEVLVLENYIRRYKADSANQITVLEGLYRHDKAISDTEVFKRIQSHKEAYISAMKKEAEKLGEYQKVDRQIQDIKESGGKTPYSTDIEIPYTYDFTINRNDVIFAIKKH
jgi:hypothetical protein